MMTALSTARPAYGLEGPSAGRTVDNATPQGSTYIRGNSVQFNGAGSDVVGRAEDRACRANDGHDYRIACPFRQGSGTLDALFCLASELVCPSCGAVEFRIRLAARLRPSKAGCCRGRTTKIPLPAGNHADSIGKRGF